MFKKAILFVFLFVLFSISSVPIVFAAYPDQDPMAKEPDYSDPSSATPDEISAAIDSGNFPADKYDTLTPDQLNGIQDKIPAENIKDIKPESIDPLEVKYPEKLTAEQLSYGDNLGKLKGTDTYSKLDQEELSKVMAKNAPPEIDVEVKADEDTKNIELTDTGIKADSIESFKTTDQGGSETLVRGAEGFENDFETRTISVEKAKSITYDVEDTKHISLVNIPSSTFIDYGDRLEIVSQADAEHNLYIISDQGDNAVIADIAKGKKLIIAKNILPEYNLAQGTLLVLPQYNLKITSSENNSFLQLRKESDEDIYLLGQEIFLSQYIVKKMKETLFAKGLSSVKANKFEGIYYAELGSPSRISFTDTAENSFLIHRSINHTSPFYLIISKPDHKTGLEEFKSRYSSTESGFIDLENNKIYLSGIIDYSSYDQYAQDKETIISRLKTNVIDLSLDENNEKIAEVMLSNPGYICEYEEILSETYNSDYHIVEICNPYDNIVERYIGFLEEQSPAKILRYSSFSSILSPIVFKSNMLRIERKNSYVRFYSGDYAKEDFKAKSEKRDEVFQRCIWLDSSILGESAKDSLFNWFLG